MKFFDRVESGVRALEDIEDPKGSELRQLRERIRILEGRQVASSTGGKRDVL